MSERIRLTRKNTEDKLIGSLLSNLRIDSNFSQAEVAKKLKSTQPGISKLEGQGGSTVKMFVKYLDAIGYDVILEKRN